MKPKVALLVCAVVALACGSAMGKETTWELKGGRRIVGEVVKIRWATITIRSRSGRDAVVGRDELTPRSREQYEQLKAQAGPLVLNKPQIGRNSIGEFVISVPVTNIWDKPVVAFEATIACFDSFGDPVSEKMTIISQRKIPPGDTLSNASWTLHFRENMRKFTIVLTRVKLENGTTWKSKPEAEPSFSGELSPDESPTVPRNPSRRIANRPGIRLQ